MDTLSRAGDAFQGVKMWVRVRIVWLERVWPNIRQGHNIELSALLVISFGVTAMSILGWASQRLVLTIAVALLALLSIALLDLRAAIGQLGGGSILASRFFSDEDLPEVLGAFDASREVWLWGSTLQTHLPLFDEPIRRGLARGNRYRVLLITRGGGAEAMARLRAPATSSEIGKYLDASLSRLESVKASATEGSLIVKTLDYLPPYVLYVFDPQLETARVYVRVSNYGGTAGDRPTFWVSRREDPVWFERFAAEFEAVWAQAAEA